MNVGIVGVGCLSGIYLKNLHEVFHELRLVAVCDLIRERAEKAQREYNVPKLYDTMDELLKLPGVGRKIPNLMLGDVYGKPAVVADTHCIRLSNRMGLCDTKDPKKVEFALRELLDPAESNDFCHRLVLHGRAVCDARKPKCEACRLAPFCPTAGADQN